MLVDEFVAVHPSRAAGLLGGMAGIAYARPWQRSIYAAWRHGLCVAVAAHHLGSASPAQHLVHITPQKRIATP